MKTKELIGAIAVFAVLILAVKYGGIFSFLAGVYVFLCLISYSIAIGMAVAVLINKIPKLTVTGEKAVEMNSMTPLKRVPQLVVAMTIYGLLFFGLQWHVVTVLIASMHITTLALFIGAKDCILNSVETSAIKNPGS